VRDGRVINGVRYRRPGLPLCVVRGNFPVRGARDAFNLPAVLQNCVDTRTDHSGTAIARLRVPSDATTQLATLRVIDVATGVYVDEVFTITQGTITAR
jgi:hypothetical protein